MSGKTWTQFVSHARRLALVCLSLAVCAELAAEESDDSFQEYWSRVYDGSHILDVQLKISPMDWNALSTAARGADSEYREATLTVDGQQLDRVGIRFKGNSSLRSSGASPRKPFKIDTNRFVKGQKLGGASKLNLSNVFADPTYLREKLGYEVFRAAGLPTPGVGWARVTLDVDGLHENRSLGLYVVIEQVNDDMLERQLGPESSKSLLMKPERLANWQYLGDDPGAYEVYNIKDGRKQEDLIGRFASVLQMLEQADTEEFEAKAADWIELESFASYLAANSLLVNLDSFVATPHNYYLLVDRADGKLKILPWDLNMCFGVFSLFRSGEDLARWSVHRPWVMDRTILVRLFELPGFRERYLAKVDQLRNTVFSESRLFSRIDELSKVIQPVLEEVAGTEAVSAQQAGVDGRPRGIQEPQQRGPRAPALRPFISARIVSVSAQLEGTEEGLVLEPIRRGPLAAAPWSPLQSSWAAVQVAEQSGDYDAALRSLDKIVEITGLTQDGYIHLRRGWILYLQGDHAAAIRSYSTAAVALPGAITPRQGLLACYQALGDQDKLIEIAGSILELSRSDGVANKALADTYYGRGDFTQASRYYLALVTNDPSDLLALSSLGWSYLQAGQLDLAATTFGNVLAVTASNESARLGLDRVTQLQRLQSRDHAVMKRMLAVLDTDQDGELSAEELAAAAEQLKKLDTDKNGVITPAEVTTPPAP